MKNKFLFCLFFTAILLLWALWAGAFNLWDNRVINYITTLGQEDEEITLEPVWLLGFQLNLEETTATSSLQEAGIECNTEEGGFFLGFQPDGIFKYFSQYCFNGLVAVNENYEQGVVFSVFYTTSTRPFSELSYNGFTYGEIVSSLFLFLTFLVACAILFLKLFKRKNQ